MTPLLDQVKTRTRHGLRAARDFVAPRGSNRGNAIDSLRDARESYPKTTRPGQDLRILVVAPPKSGNMWIKCLLANAYGLAWIPEHQGPQRGAEAGLRAFVEAGHFRPGTIMHRHYGYSPEFVEIARSVPCQLVTIVRDPYDLFVSYYYHLQTFTTGHQRNQVASATMTGKPLDHPDVLAYLAGDFGKLLARAEAWVRSGDSLVVRYEDLHRDQLGELTRVTALIRAASPTEIGQAVTQCSADAMRGYSRNMAKHVRKATVGDSKQRLGPEHLAIFRERYAGVIRDLGYEAR